MTSGKYLWDWTIEKVRSKGGGKSVGEMDEGARWEWGVRGICKFRLICTTVKSWMCLNEAGVNQQPAVHLFRMGLFKLFWG